MSNSKVLKSSTPHQVKLREGSKDAQRKATKAPVEKVDVPAPSQRKVKVLAEPVKAVKPVKVATPAKAAPAPKAVKVAAVAKTALPLKPVKSIQAPVQAPLPAAVVVPASIAKKSRTKVKANVQEKPAAVDSSPMPTVTAPAPVSRAPVPEEELWETDSPVMRRISILRSRNAQLSEQIHRLKKPA